jgi:cellulose synthase/poly-beta-1,6-N-acetylglucosamine synthase-like glycosyltransferase
MTDDAVAPVALSELLEEARRRIAAVPEDEAAGSLAVVEVRVPESAGPADVEIISGLVARTAAELGAWVAFDEDQGHFLLLLPLTRTWVAAEVLGELLRRLAGVDIRGGRRRIRPSVGAGVVALTGHLDASGTVGEIDLALTEAIGLAHRSSLERAFRVHTGQAATGAGGRSIDQRRTPMRRRLQQRYLKLSSGRKAWVLAVSNLALAWIVPFLVYAALYRVLGVDVSRIGFWLVLGAVVVTALTVYAEGVLALRPASPPDTELAAYPDASAIVVAYLPNETTTVMETVHSLLAQDYPGRLEVVLAYNTPRRLAIEQDLARLAAGDARLILLRVGDSTSKAQNINAALQVTRSEIIGIFDADHRPMPGAFRRAAAWLASGVDVVQGRSVVRNGDSNWLARMVAVEFEGIYAVAHPGRAALHTFGIFGGSNGFWRAEVLDRLRMRPDMLTEDIDISIRAVFSGSRIAVDSQLISEELAPLTPLALWAQRIRWSHGWHQVSRKQVGKVWRTKCLSVRQRLGASFLLGWREAYPWVSAQMVPILAFSLLVRDHIQVDWLAPLFLITTIYVSAVGPVQALFAWRLSVPEMRRRRWWWWEYVFLTSILFGEFKALVNRAAHLRELIGDRAWQVTPRTSAQPGGGVARLQSEGMGSELVTMGRLTGETASVQLDLPLRLPASPASRTSPTSTSPPLVASRPAVGRSASAL